MEEESVLIVDVWRAVRAHWLVVAVSLIVFGVTAGVIAYRMTPEYQSSVLVTPVSDQGAKSTLGGLLGQFGGLASMAGSALGVGASNEYEALAMLNSRQFTERFIAENDLLPILFADRFDSERQDWVEGKRPPDLADGVRRFSKIRFTVDDRQTGFITLTVQWTDPQQAADWANGLVELLNEVMRDAAIEDAERGLEYLDRELDKTSVLEIRQAIYALMEGQIRRKMLANVRQDFALRVLDKAVVPKEFEYVSPREVPMIAAGVIIGGVVGVGLALLLWARARPPQD